MDISRYFIDRPRFAAVLSIFIFLVGALAIFRLPVSEYPEVAPPQVAPPHDHGVEFPHAGDVLERVAPHEQHVRHPSRLQRP